ncbi:hypothetical protein [Deinococcus pimensis]|uniref:hypothetical protein n=1 Tax=Deinococcus pimensis TaxID=309888 RepID=UPI00048211CC|nr:hypothetical protein [Deinococcus pimensis]
MQDDADLENIWGQVRHGSGELRRAVYRLLGPDLGRWGPVREGDLPEETRRPRIERLQREQS